MQVPLPPNQSMTCSHSGTGHMCERGNAAVTSYGSCGVALPPKTCIVYGKDTIPRPKPTTLYVHCCIEVQDLVPQLCRFWPSWSGPQDEKCAGMPPGQHSECFWKHEWDKHGTCSAVNAATAAAARNAGQYLEPHEYFEQVLQLHQQYDIEQALSAARIVPSDSDTYDSGDILGALQNAFGKKAYIECQRGLLTEVTTCLDKNLEIIDCRQSSDSCDSVSIPTDVPSDGFYQEYYMKGDELPAGVAAN
eukprot:GHUV01010471.1.p1 GENE.GHUV01010471.1~~GHUV01010471.1.p1  ORF type:complete len:248 (+),score=47.83 GHUV01010471.1:637-1380(+)